MEHVLEVRDMKIAYRGNVCPAVEGCSFQLNRGEILGIAGESGSGKTTLILSLIGLLDKNAMVSGGRVWLNGEEITPPLSEKKYRTIRGKKIAVVMQNAMSCLDPSMKIGRQLTESIRYHRKCSAVQATEQARELLDLTGIRNPEECMRKYPHECSGGMQQRICIAIALSGKPEVLIADEPTTALDVTVQAQILNLLRRISRDRGMPMIFISHDLGVLTSLCTRILVMHQGQIIEEGNPDDLVRGGTEAYTKSLIGAKQMLERRKIRGPSETKFFDGNTLQSEDRSVVSLNHVDKYFGKYQVLRDITMEIRKGEVYGLVGESGSGKTTLARLIQGIYTEDGGRIRWSGDKEVSRGKKMSGDRHGFRKCSRHTRSPVQMIFQNPYQALNPSMTILENLEEPLRTAGIKGENAKARAAEMAENMGLESAKLGDKPGQLSGGQLQRAVIARALLSEPELMICDEPFSALDAGIQVKLVELLKQIKREQNITVMFIGHDLSVLNQFSDRIGVMYGGALVEEGNTEEMEEEPWHPYTKTLFEAAARVKLSARRDDRKIVMEERTGREYGTGCPFYRNCIYAVRKCAVEIPELYTYKDRRVKCFLYAPDQNEKRDTNYHMTAQI